MNPKISFVFLLSISLLLPAATQAAQLYFSPSSGSYYVGQTFSVGVYVSTPDQAMNAASGIISFPKDKLQAISPSKTNSIFDLWVQEPNFSNSDGIINFAGITLNPGFIGSGGKLIGITFKAKANGNASVSFSYGEVLANDGQGTNILTNSGKANFTITTQAQTPEATTTPIVIIESPKITCYPQKLNEGEIFTVRGLTYPQSAVGMYLEDADGNISYTEAQSDAKGNFSLTYNKNLSEGIYNFWVDVTDAQGIKSVPTEKLTLTVVRPNVFNIFGLTINYLVALIGLLGLIILMLLILLGVWLRGRFWRKKLSREVQESEKSLHESFDSLRKEVERQVAKLDSSPGLSDKEKEICDDLKEILKTMEKIISKEIKHIKELTGK
jgi:hypothetical protein